MADPSVNKLVESFESPNIPPINGEPMYTMLHAMHELLTSSAASVATNLGCGTLRYLCFTLSPTVYATLLTTQVVPSLNPGATPVIPAGVTGPEAPFIRYTYDAATIAFIIISTVDRALRQQLLGAVEEMFLRVKHKLHHGYSGNSTLDLLNHLYETYAVISISDWLANNKRFREPYSLTVSIEVTWQQIDGTVAYTNVGSTPYSSKQVADNAYQLVFNTGIFAADFRKWNKRAADDKVLPRLKVFFVAAHRKWRLSLRKETGTPYGAVHNATAHPDDG